MLLLCASVSTGAQEAFAQSATSTSTTTTSIPSSQANSSSVSVSPAILDYTVDPGRSFSTPITIANLTQQPMAMRATARDFIPDGKLDPSYKAAYDASSWLAIGSQNFLLAPQEQRSVSVTILIPADAEPGGHYATVYFESFVADQPSSASEAFINARIGVLVMLSVKGAIKESIKAVGPIQTDSLQTEAGPTNFRVTLRNEGNVHVRPTGAFTVRDAIGRKQTSLSIPPGILLPGVERSYDATWEHGVRLGTYTASAEISLGKDRPVLHPGKARVWFIPLVFVIPIAFVLILVSSVLILRRRNKRRRGRARAKAIAHLRGHTDEIEDSSSQAPEPASTEPGGQEGEGSAAETEDPKKDENL